MLPRSSEGVRPARPGFAAEVPCLLRACWWHVRCGAMPPMNSEPIVSARFVPATLSIPRRRLRYLIALGIPLVFVAACDSGQLRTGTGGAAGSTTTGTGGKGGSGIGGGSVGGGASGGVGGGSGGAGGSAGAGGGAGNAAGQGGHGAGGAGGVGGAGGGASCATAASGAACTSEGMTCGGPCTDICQFCNLLTCTGGHWQAMEAAPAPCFCAATASARR